MTTLSIFQPEITTLETQLTALQTQLEELRQAEDIATQLLSTLADTLPRFEKLGAIARIKSALLGLFGETDAPKLENFMNEVPAAKPTTEEIFDAEVLPQQAQERRNPVRDRFSKVLGFEYRDCSLSFVRDYLLNNSETFMQAAHWESLTGKAFWDACDAYLDKYEAKKAESRQTTIEDAIAEVQQQPAEPAAPATVEPAAEPEQMSAYIEQIFLTRTVAYQKKHTGEIVCAYIGSANQKLAQNWADCVQLWGCEAEVRKAKRMSAADIRWEVKIRKISKAQLDQIAANHTSPFQSVPQVARPAEKKNEDADQAGQSVTTGDAASEPKPQVSLVLGKADNIYTTYHVYLEGKEIGRVERMSATTNSWTVPRLPGDWESAEAAADALIAKREADKRLH